MSARDCSAFRHTEHWRTLPAEYGRFERWLGADMVLVSQCVTGEVWPSGGQPLRMATLFGYSYLGLLKLQSGGTALAPNVPSLLRQPYKPMTDGRWAYSATGPGTYMGALRLSYRPQRSVYS
jgi:hypothetical protein